LGLEREAILSASACDFGRVDRFGCLYLPQERGGWSIFLGVFLVLGIAEFVRSTIAAKKKRIGLSPPKDTIELGAVTNKLREAAELTGLL
jgi:hypothetical protein